MLPLPIAQCHAVVESLELPYPLYSSPDLSVFEDYGTGHIAYAPKQSWVGIDPEGILRFVWRSGERAGPEGVVGRVPLPLEVLEEFSATLA